MNKWLDGNTQCFQQQSYIYKASYVATLNLHHSASYIDNYILTTCNEKSDPLPNQYNQSWQTKLVFLVNLGPLTA